MTIRKRIAAQKPDLNIDSSLMLKEQPAADYIGVSMSYLRKSRCQGALRHETPAPPFVKIGGGVFYRVSDLKAWVDGLTSKQVI